jgi:hypothetical protein
MNSTRGGGIRGRVRPEAREGEAARALVSLPQLRIFSRIAGQPAQSPPTGDLAADGAARCTPTLPLFPSGVAL